MIISNDSTITAGGLLDEWIARQAEDALTDLVALDLDVPPAIDSGA